jgi:hypothetical protein
MTRKQGNLSLPLGDLGDLHGVVKPVADHGAHEHPQ